MFGRYLPDFGTDLQRAAVNAWLSGRLGLNQDQEVRGRLLAIRELQELSLPMVRLFYGLEMSNEPIPPAPTRRPGQSY